MNKVHSPTLSNDRKTIALQRWKILKQALTGSRSSETRTSDGSIRRFSGYGLLKTEKLSMTPEGSVWYQYTAPSQPGFAMSVRHLPGTIDASTLLGFNNTGNVCVWPAEEVMTDYCLKNSEQFRDCSVCELGGGMTCLAGLALAIVSKATSVLISDGNEDSVENLNVILSHQDNQSQFDNTKVSSRLIRWGGDTKHEDLEGRFDFVLCADCLFFDDGRADLADLIFDILKPNGKAIIYAPHRGPTFESFRDLAQKQFHVDAQEKYSPEVWDLHCKMKMNESGIYDENIHFPLLMTLTKHS
ncbi:calmodulin-lysine N-methyltransferase-like [Ostrea edulis]|uniref:calmodulin-lysine N-methyltransferase-like n=1 Tax=Ostrea edulis TaxID=37623 RepID=UPI00209652BE|nr:calmodulin-lysine N-methyltransferase-like [Ostrea edulis]